VRNLLLSSSGYKSALAWTPQMSYRQANAGLVTDHNRNNNSSVRMSVYLLKVTNSGEGSEF
jgi:hypothetical protein